MHKSQCFSYNIVVFGINACRNAKLNIGPMADAMKIKYSVLRGKMD